MKRKNKNIYEKEAKYLMISNRTKRKRIRQKNLKKYFKSVAKHKREYDCSIIAFAKAMAEVGQAAEEAGIAYRNTKLLGAEEYEVQTVYACEPTEPTENDEYFGFICKLDDGDDIKDESNWIKANPTVGAMPITDNHTKVSEELRHKPKHKKPNIFKRVMKTLKGNRRKNDSLYDSEGADE